jgi:hypothetical protein
MRMVGGSDVEDSAINENLKIMKFDWEAITSIFTEHSSLEERF